MKKKQAVYVLLPLVIIIWGIVIWKIVYGVSSKVMETKPEVLATGKVALSTDSVNVELSFNYEDPFLKHSSFDDSQKVQKIEKVNESENTRLVQWPVVEYRGALKSRKKKSLVGMIKIGDKEYLVREKQEVNAIYVFHISNDSIGLVHQQNKRYFKIIGNNTLMQ